MAAGARKSAESAATASAAVPTQLPELPEAAVACILQHVNLQQRLTCCALVSRAWAAAAAAGPAVVDISLKSSEHCQQLQRWLAKHAAAVVVLVACGDGPKDRWHRLQLPVQPFTQLRSLSLGGQLNLQLPAEVTSRSSTEMAGSSLTGASSSNAAGSLGSAAAAASVLPQLGELALWSCKLPAQLLSQLLSATSLTRLQIQHLAQEETYAALWERLQLLPQLLELKLIQGSLAAAGIAPLSSLQHLQHLKLHAAINSLVGDGSRGSELLASLQHLTQLRFLDLRYMQLHRVNAQPQQQGDSYQCFSALTASTQLTALHLGGGLSRPVPQAAFQHMFPPGRVLPHLREVRLEGARGLPFVPCVEAAQIAMIAASCLPLQELTLLGVTPVDFDVNCLSQLPSGVMKVKYLGWSRPVP